MTRTTRTATAVALTLAMAASGCAQHTLFNDHVPPLTDTRDVPLARTIVSAALARTSGDPQTARLQTSLLTDSDVLVLASNPRMLQVAGWESSDTVILIIAVAVIVVLVALAANGSGFLIFSS